MPLSDSQKSSIRRHLKYGNIGLSVETPGYGTLGSNAGFYRRGESVHLESRMNDLQPCDEAAITGAPYAVLAFRGYDPQDGDQITVQFTGGGLSSPVNVSLTAAGQKRADMAAALALKCSQTSMLNAAGIFAMAAGRQNDPYPQSDVQFIALSSFNVSITSQTGKIGAVVLENNAKTDVQQVIDEVTYYGYLPICNVLYSLIGSASDRMGTAKADVFTARKSEAKDRRAFYLEFVQDMATFLVADLNPHARGGPSNHGRL